MRHHLAVLHQAYLTQIVMGRKTVECRLGRKGMAPNGMVQPGDLLWLKEVSGPICAAVRVQEVHSIPLGGAGAVERIRRDWNDRILAPASFWRAGRDASVATLILLGDLCSFRPFRIVKSDRRAWVTLAHPPVPGRSLRSEASRRRQAACCAPEPAS
ncbi:MAG TPA: ASCH domain-containing protein [Phycisphaerae bacterium]|nr:ASCH domain-containing protein [Phycisphaerae bacterium]HOJ73512.1 ASCH domain-containing protein [Phycisphaerae bacterium]HOM51680.1 ASCH domain-containing protein [Phycisphaerae bacterium]HON68328.1 ASCH domain-containing protein [Phycisphaerae bacterium]HOQ86277.1 ASCH domain-containing protein [Phycisphaerae bacterium]